MSDQSDAITFAAVGLGAAALAGLAYAVIPQLTAHTIVPLRERSVFVPSDRREALANAPREWRPLPAPSGARLVPLIDPPRTPFPDARALTTRVATSSELYRASLAETKRILRASGRGDEDARCVNWLWQKETGWGRSCWGRNLGNRKAGPLTYASPELIRSGQVYTSHAQASAVYALVDRVNSLDVYNAFDSWEASCRDEKRLFEFSRYAGVLEGYRQGGLEGLQAAITAMHRGGYSPGVLATKVAECSWYWRLASRLAGEEFVR